MYHTVSQLLNNPRGLVYLNDEYMKENFNFKSHDIQFLKLFWQPDFDESWLLFDEPFIETWLIQDTNLTLNQLYQQILTMFHKEVDYKLSLSEAAANPVYLVKGHCLKNLCIICNKLFRDFFIRLARVAHMLMLAKSIDDNSTQITINKASKQIEALSQKTDNLTFLVEEIVGERVEEVAKKVVGDSCDEVINLIKLSQPCARTPIHLRNAGYVVIRCLRKNYTKHLNRVGSYAGFMMQEVFSTPIANRGINLVKKLRDMGVETHKSNGVSSDNVIDLIEKVKSILDIEDMVM